MDIHFKNLSFPVNFWITHEDSLRSLLPLRHIGFIDRKTGWVRSQFDTANFSLILNGGGEFHRKGRCWKVEAPCVITQLDGDYLEYGPSEPHEFWTELYLVYSLELMPRFVQCGFVDDSRPVWPISNPTALRPLLEELARCLATKEKSARIDRIAERIILETLVPPHVPANTRILKASEAIQNNWQSPPRPGGPRSQMQHVGFHLPTPLERVHGNHPGALRPRIKTSGSLPTFDRNQRLHFRNRQRLRVR
jgi:hypothetical protein